MPLSSLRSFDQSPDSLRFQGIISHLGLARAGLGREVDEQRQELLLGEVVHEFVLDVHALACACGTHKQDGSEMEREKLPISTGGQKVSRQMKY